MFRLFVFQMSAEVSIGEPFKACSPLTNGEELKHRIAVLERGDCMFIDKACTWYYFFCNMRLFHRMMDVVDWCKGAGQAISNIVILFLAF